MAVRGLLPKLPTYFDKIAKNTKEKNFTKITCLFSNDFISYTLSGKKIQKKEFKENLKKFSKNFYFNDVYFVVEKSKIIDKETMVVYVSENYFGTNKEKQHLDVSQLVRYVITCTGPIITPRPPPWWPFGLGIKEVDVIKQDKKIDGKIT